MINDVITREMLTEELRQLEGSMRELSREQKRRVQTIAAQLRNCACRNCGKHYDESKARGDYKGFCSAKCQHEKARSLGYRKGRDRTEYDVLKRAECVGSVFVCQ